MTPATQAQVRAADPGASSWVSANAGSGKTRVLTDRVARLLLRGVDPMAILCLTYTKAAAAEMQNRLFQRLGAWAMLPEDELRAQIAELGEAPQVVEAADLARSRTLFARALETPGGLKIQTIHSFCEQLLRRFPLEASIPPQFQVLDERQAAQIRAELLEDLAATGSGFGDLAPHILGLEGDIDGLLLAILSHRDDFRTVPDRTALQRAMGIAGPAEPLGAMLAKVIAPAELQALAAALAASEKISDQPFATVLGALSATGGADPAAFDAAYLTGTGTICARLATNGVADAMPEAPELQARIATAVLDHRAHRLAEAAVERSLALGRFAHAFLAAYAARKAALGRLDFDDLIDAARHLLADSTAKDWVRYRLDGGIRHVLVDEAQDTSPAQWQVIDALTQEFFAGAGAVAGPRTIFVVGDLKQSIYSFQGADPAAFGGQRLHYQAALGDVGRALEDCALEFSFRSAEPVLQVVDTVLSQGRDHGLGTPIAHHAFKTDLPGRVEVWPHVEGDPGGDDLPWEAPLDQLPATDPARLLAEMIAKRVKSLLDSRPILPGAEKPLDPADILILVRSRNKVFSETIRALKEAGVAVAGADRLKVAEQLAVKDLLSLLRFLALPEDDLSLAEVLRSPIGNLGERDLYHLAQGRPGTLWQAVRNSAHDGCVGMLRDLRGQADFLRPFELLDRVLIRHGARRRIRARLGLEAEEAVDALLGLSLEYERVETPTLNGFLDWMSTGDPELKRQLDPKGGEVRVMTVHGAKGLEAPVVILPDTAKRASRAGRAPLVRVAPGAVTVKSVKEEQPDPVRRELDLAAYLEMQEDWRLLYVAMTRAEQWLIVCGGGDEKAMAEGWYGRIAAAMDHLGAATEADGSAVLDKGWGAMRRGDPEDDGAAKAAPAWLRALPAAPRKAPAPLAPSRVAPSGPHGGSGEGAEAALRRGRQMHLLLEHLPGFPREDRATIAASLLAGGEDAAADHELAPLLAEASGVIDDPDLDWLFAPGSRAEVPVSGQMGPPLDRPVSGIIDRLVVRGRDVWAVDYKTDRLVPPGPADVPQSYAAQLALYQAALARIYPDHTVRTALLWTSRRVLMPISHDDVTALLQSLAAH